MRHIALFLLLSAFLISCKSSKKKLCELGHPVAPVPAFVETTDNVHTDVKKVQKRKKQVIADGKKIDVEKVAAYSDGKHTFVSTTIEKKSVFVSKEFTGDINIYGREVTTGGSPTYSGVTPGNPSGWSSGSSSSGTVYYYQKSGSPAILLGEYKNIKPMISPTEPAYKHILAYEQRVKKSRIVKYAGLGCIAGALVLLFANPSDDALALGGAGVLLGPIVYFTGGLVKVSGKRSLQIAVGVHNGTCNVHR